MKTNNKDENISTANSTKLSSKDEMHEKRMNLLVDNCYFQWESNNEEKLEGDIFYEGFKKGIDVYGVVRTLIGNHIIYKEHRAYCHIDDAWKILQFGKFGYWRNCRMLITLRQALRERFVQGMPIEKPKIGIGERKLKKWLTIARHYDSLHHGQPTF